MTSGSPIAPIINIDFIACKVLLKYTFTQYTINDNTRAKLALIVVLGKPLRKQVTPA